MEVLKKVLNIIIDIFIVIVVIVSATIAVISVTARDSGVSNVFGYVPFSVQSNSMSPVFEAGDMIVGKLVPEEERKPGRFQEGDIVTFWDSVEHDGVPESFLNTHRITGISNTGGTYSEITTKGDNNDLEDDGVITENSIVAVWSSEGKDDGIRVQKIGAVLDYLRKPSGFFLAVLLPMAIFFIYELVRFLFNFKNYSKEKQKQAALEVAKELMGDTSDSSGLSEEQKAQAILDYLEKQKAEQATAGGGKNQAEETEQPASVKTAAVTEPEQEEVVSDVSED